MKRASLTELVEISHRYGSDSRYVLLGGGNTSYKEDAILYVKASGTALATISPEGFVAMSMDRLEAIWDKEYPQESAKREEAILSDMMNARCEGEQARPSVEALLHAGIPYRYVVHLHPTLVNGVTCAQSGQEAIRHLFPDALWIPLVNPGYILAKTVREAQRAYTDRHKVSPTIIFLQNHGIFVASDTTCGIDLLYEQVMSTIEKQLVRKPQFDQIPLNTDRIKIAQSALQEYYQQEKPPLYACNRELKNRLESKESFFSISSSYTPDHIVYSGFAPLWIGDHVFSCAHPTEEIGAYIERYEHTHAVSPKIIAIQQCAVFALSEGALALFLDTVQVAAYTESFGGPRFMDDDQIEFIRNWEVESYRAKVLK